MREPLTPRTCYECSKPKGTIAFRVYALDGTSDRQYFHLDCFRKYNVDRNKSLPLA